MKDIFSNLNKLFPGFLLVLCIGFLSKLLSLYIVIGTIAIAILLGIIINNVLTIDKVFKPGISFCEKKVLNIAIILMGSQLNYAVLATLNYKTIIIIITLIFAAIISSFILGKIFKLSSSLSILLGVGNGICGSSAIAGASSVLDSKKEDVVLSISIINILGTAGIFLVPAMIRLFDISSIYEQGVVIGSTIQAVGQVTAAGYIMGDEVGRFATFIKMVRILALGPILICLSLVFNKKSNQQGLKKVFSIPPFIIGFIVLSIIANMNIIPPTLILYLNYLSKYLLILSMVAIGLNVSISSLYDKGFKVVIVSFITFLIQLFLCIHFVT